MFYQYILFQECLDERPCDLYEEKLPNREFRPKTISLLAASNDPEIIVGQGLSLRTRSFEQRFVLEGSGSQLTQVIRGLHVIAVMVTHLPSGRVVASRRGSLSQPN